MSETMADWDEIARLLELASQVEPSRRAQFLKENTTDPALEAEVLELLAASGDETQMLDRPVPIHLDSGLEGAMAGNCRLTKLVGEGGMGSVYEAVRRLDVPGVEQRVAVKVWHRGKLNLAEMEREAGLLARVEHPGIARLLDTGLLEGGQPYLVMEFVEGKTIDQYAAGRGLEEKIELMRRVCAAVGAAHRALIAHRDIKPSNILVTAEGTPKLIDFGISKSMEDATKTVEMRLTPRYASPEQLRGEAITTATDIYSLGVVMYELFTGAGPFADKKGTELVVAICEAPVPAPALPTDLASIVLKAMARRPEDRYASVTALDEDLQRYLRREPVAAVEATWMYRARKYVVRHRLALAVGVATLMLVGAGFGRAYWEARQAAKRFDQVRGLARSLLFEIHDEVSKVPGTLESRKLILARALEYLDELSKDESAGTPLQFDLAESYMKVGKLQGSLVRSDESLGRFRDALASYVKAVTILERLQSREPKDRTVRAMLAKAVDEQASVCSSLQDYQCADREFERARDLYALDARENPDDFMAQARWLTARISTTDPLIREAKYREARDRLDVVAREFEALGAKYPGERKLGPYLAYSFKRLGAIEGKIGNYHQGVEWYQKAKRIHQRWNEQMGESTCEVDTAWLFTRMKRTADAFAAYDRALKIRRELAEGRGADQPSKLALISVLLRKGSLLNDAKQHREALVLLREALAILEPLEKMVEQNPSIKELAGSVHFELGNAYYATGQTVKTREEYTRTLELWGEATRSDEIDLARQRLGLPPLPGRAKPLR